MERRKRPMPRVTWDDQTPSCTLSLSQERIPTSTSSLDGWQHLSNPQVPWGTEAPRALWDQPFSLRFSMGIGNIRGYGEKKKTQPDFWAHALGVFGTLDNFLLLLPDFIKTQASGLLRLLQEPRVGCSSLGPSSHQAGPKKKIECVT